MNFKKIFLFLFFLGTITFVFVGSPQETKAGTFGGLKVTTKIKYPGQSSINLSGVIVRVDNNSTSFYIGRCGGGPYASKPCSSAGIVNLSTNPDTCMTTTSKTTNSSGEAVWDTDSGVVFASCNCDFKIDLSAPAAPSGYVYDGGWSPAEPYTTGSWENNDTKSLTFTINLKADTPPDSFSYSLSCSPTNINGLVCGNSGSTTCTITPNHPAEPNHTVSYRWDRNFDGDFNDSGEGYGTTSQQTFTFNYNNYFSPTSSGSRNINLMAQARCSGGIEPSAQTRTITLNRGPRVYACDSLTARPAFGVIPLNVQFIATVSDSWSNISGCGITADRYEWDFGTGETRTTTTNTTNYTYANQGNFTARFIAYFGANPVNPCINNNTLIGSEYWTESNWTEVAP